MSCKVKHQHMLVDYSTKEPIVISIEAEDCYICRAIIRFHEIESWPWYKKLWRKAKNAIRKIIS